MSVMSLFANEVPVLEAERPSLNRALAGLGMAFLTGNGTLYPQHAMDLRRYVGGGLKNVRLEEYQSTQRAGLESVGGSGYGFAIQDEWANEVWDRQRGFGNPFFPFAQCRKYTTTTLEKHVVGYGETNQKDGLRYGGINSKWLGTEATDLTTIAGDAKLMMITFKMNRLVAYCALSNDVLADSFFAGNSTAAETGLMQAVYGEFRTQLDRTLINGWAPAPLGVITCAGNQGIAVARQTGSQISDVDLNAMWARLDPNSQETAVWCCAPDARVEVLNATRAVSGGMWSKEVSIFPGAIASIHGRPLVCPTAGMPTLGSLGDVILVDWKSVGLCYRTMPGPGDTSGISVAVGLPPDVIEARRSGDFLYSTDQVAFYFKLRVDAKPLWHQPVTIYNQATTVSPLVILK